MEAGLFQSSSMDKAFYYFLAAWQAVVRHHQTEALEFIKTSIEYSDMIEAPQPIALSALGAAVIYHELGKYAESTGFLDRARRLAEAMNSWSLIYMCNLLAAQFAFDRGNESNGLICLRAAMKLGREEGVVHMYWVRTDVMARLCAKALEYEIESDYVQDLICTCNLMPEDPVQAGENWPWPLKVHTLGSFEILRNGTWLEFSGKVQKKPLQMLKVLIAAGGRNVSAEYIADSLWPDADGDMAYQSFEATLHRLRRLINVENAIQRHEGIVSLNDGCWWTDAWTFERMIEKGESALKAETGKQSSGEKTSIWKSHETEADMQHASKNRVDDVPVIRYFERAIRLYHGHFLSGEEAQPWSIHARERLRSKLLRVTLELGQIYEKFQQWDKAIECYRKAMEVDGLAEEFYQRLMICHQHVGNKAEAILTYKRCCSVLSASMGLEPSEKTQLLYRQIEGL
jgi:DNA-binding SARP family transcriptional activator